MSLVGLKWVYKVLRSIIFSVVIFVAVLFVVVYSSLSIPPVQNYIRDRIESELATLFGSDIEIGNLSIMPVNEVILNDVSLTDLNGKECLKIRRLGAGINLWRLIFRGDIEVTFVELLDFSANIYQKSEGEPLNIDFIIKAFAPKNKNKPPTLFDLKIHNIVIRGGNLKFDKLWLPSKGDHLFDPNHISLHRFSADVTIPRLSNYHSVFDLRRLSFNEESGLQVKDISGFFALDEENLNIKNFSIQLPQTEINLADFNLPLSFFKNSGQDSNPLSLRISGSRLTPSNLSAFLPPLSAFDISLPLEADLRVSKNDIEINDFRLGSTDNLLISLAASAHNFSAPKEMTVDCDDLQVTASQSFMDYLAGSPDFFGERKELASIIRNIGSLALKTSGEYNSANGACTLNTSVATAAGSLEFDYAGHLNGDFLAGNLSMEIPSFEFSDIVSGFPLQSVADASIVLDASLNLKSPMASSGTLNINVGDVGLFNRNFKDIVGRGEKDGNFCSLNLTIDDENLNGTLLASALLDGVDSEWHLDADFKDFDTYSSLITESAEKGYEMKGAIRATAIGNSVDNLRGTLELSDFMVRKWNGNELQCRYLFLSVDESTESLKSINLSSDFLDLDVKGDYVISQMPGMVKRTLWEVSPALFPAYDHPADCGSGNFVLTVKDAKPVIDFFNLPVLPLTTLNVTGFFDGAYDIIELSTDIPFIQQGENKLITDTYLDVKINGSRNETALSAGTVYPTKKGLLKLDADLSGKNGDYGLVLGLNRGRNVPFYGDVSLRIKLGKDGETGNINVNTVFQPSTLHLYDADWELEQSEIAYSHGFLGVDGFCVRHDEQFVIIDGYNNMEGEGELQVRLSDINMDYIFETLNINHVTFGGTASGEVIARDIFGKVPDIHTENLRAERFSYNGALLGEADLFGSFDLPAKQIGIGAVIRNEGNIVAEAKGGVWLGRDSLAFDFKADKVNVGFMQPFMSAFSSDIKGKASGDVKLFGTFSDIDMTGVIAAENVDIMIDYINARYEGSDTVYLYPGRIDIPKIVVRDKFGHSALVSGELTHHYFHDPVFNFKISEMDRLLVYDTNARINPLWYGVIFASGSGEVSGRPGLVRIAADVETEGGSDFTFVLSDQQEAVKSNFLTFSDRKKEEAEKLVEKDTVPDFLQKFRKNHNVDSSESSDVFIMDFRVSVTDDVRFNLIMDPVAGDKIIAYGEGAMTLTYSSRSDELKLYGKYVLERGTYNFSLQDIILKEFTIKPGSSIAFTGDPYTGILNITAAYRVNTSLTELDQSFANDRELNRTSVPVEALLKVSGVLTSPNIDFDIDLPTVTEETAQKVRSIISTEDMMSRQVLYLVALNKFYPPEYMSTSNSGGEWASIASSTISSQIQNMIGQITDKFTLAPSIRSDKGDFSDIEVDLALSSQLFNNRLLINGNVGYRDPSNSSTTFVGDFDIEYLLNRKGTWRLKAYNHFNDQNYYLKSALTTQGLGIVWRKDFGIPRKKEEQPAPETPEEDKGEE